MGKWFGSQIVGLEPDAIVMAKGITGGYAPLGAVAFESSLARVLARTGFPHGLTFSGHPVSCAAARATIRILRDEDLVRASASKGRVLLRRLEEIADSNPGHIRDVRGRGLLVALELRGRRRWKKGAPHPAASRLTRLQAALAKAGVLAYGPPGGGFLLLSPPFTVAVDRIDRLAQLLSEALLRSARA